MKKIFLLLQIFVISFLPRNVFCMDLNGDGDFEDINCELFQTNTKEPETENFKNSLNLSTLQIDLKKQKFCLRNFKKTRDYMANLLGQNILLLSQNFQEGLICEKGPETTQRVIQQTNSQILSLEEKDILEIITDQVSIEEIKPLISHYFLNGFRKDLTDNDLKKFLRQTLGLGMLENKENGSVVLQDIFNIEGIFNFLGLFFKEFTGKNSILLRDPEFLKELIHEKRETFLKKIEKCKKECDIEIKQGNGYKKLNMASLKIQYDPLSVSNVIFFGSLSQTTPPYLKFFLKNLDVFKKNKLQYVGWMDGPLSFSTFFLEELWPQNWKTLRGIKGIGYGFSMGGHAALNYALTGEGVEGYRPPCIVINPASNISLFKKEHEVVKKNPHLPEINLNEKEYNGNFHLIYWAFSQESKIDSMALYKELESPHWNSLIALHPLNTSEHCNAKWKNPSEFIDKTNQFMNQSPKKEDDSQKNTAIFDGDTEEDLPQAILGALNAHKKVIVKNKIIEIPEKIPPFSIGFILDSDHLKKVEEKNYENLKSNFYLFMKQKELTHDGIRFMERALALDPFLELETEFSMDS